MSLAQDIPDNKVDTPVKRLFASDAERIMKPQKQVTLPEYERGAFERAYAGAVNTISSMKDIPEQIEIFGDRIQLGFSGYFGASDEYIDRKKANLITAERNLLNIQKDRYAYSSSAEQETLSYALGGGAVNYGTMLLPVGVIGYTAKALKTTARALQTAVGIGTMATLELGGQVSERTPIKDGEIDIEKITPEWARKTTATTGLYLATSAVLEKYVGLGSQLNAWSKPIKLSSEIASNVASVVKRIGTTAAITGISEGMTEGAQSLASTGFMLADGTVDISQLPEKLKEAWKEAVVGGIIGSASGTAVGINQRANVLKGLHEIVDPVIGDINVANEIVNEIYRTGTADLTTIMSKELELSSELEAKHGLIMDNMGKAIYDAIAQSGAFENVLESEIAEYVADTSKLFADQVLAEANKRGVLIDGILSGSQIAFKDGKIQLANGENVVAENDLGDINISKPKMTNDEKTRLDELLNANRKIENGQKIIKGMQKTKKQQPLMKYIRKIGGISPESPIAKEFKFLGFTNKNTQGFFKDNGKRSLDTIPVVEFNNMFPEYKYHEEVGDNGLVPESYILDIAEKEFNSNAEVSNFEQEVGNLIEELDYFNITTKGKTNQEIISELEDARNKYSQQDAVSRGEDLEFDIPFFQTGKITETPEFKAWFGDSKVVDADGNPLVVYHGTTQTITEFDPQKSNIENDLGKGIYMSNSEDDIELNYANKEGADLTSRIERLAERIEGEEDIDYEDALTQAKERLIGGEPETLELYVSMQDPVILGGENETIFDMEQPLDKDGEPDYDEEPTGLLTEFAQSIEELSYEYGFEAGEIIANIYEAAGYESIGASDLVKVLKESEAIMYAEDPETGELAGNEIIRAAFEATGFDGIIDNTVYEKLGKGRRMQGVYQDTTHYIAFNPNQVKSVDNRGTFDPSDPRILNQRKKGSFSVSQQAIELTKDADFSTLPHELAHYWLTNMFDYTKTGKASDAYMKNFRAVQDYLGIDDNQKFLTRKQQEKFATGYEKYLRQGTLPNRMIGDFYDDYDKWLKKVYTQVPRNRLTPQMVEFFKTMTTGQLVEPTGYAPSPEMIKETKAQITKDSQEVITAKQNDIKENVVTVNTTEFKPNTEVERNLNRTPVIDTLDTGESAVFAKHAEEAGLGSLEYNVANIEKQNKLAEEYLQSNPQDVQDIVYGRKEAPANILKNAIFNAYLKQMLATGNNQEYINALKMQSLELTRAGQEIASQRGVVKDIFDPAGWIMQIMQGRKFNISEKYDATVDKAISDNIDSVLSKDTVEDQQKEIDRVTKSVAKELGVKPEELFQTLNEKLTSKKSVYNAIRNQIDEVTGVTLSNAEAGSLIAQTDLLRKNAVNSIDKNGNPSVEFFKILNDTENLANSLNPTNSVSVLTSIVGRGMMLASIKSPFLNIESNFLNSILERLTRRAMLSATSDVKIEDFIDVKLKKEYMEYSSNVYKNSGYTVSGMLEIDPKVQFKGEKFQHSQGKGIIRSIGRMVEQTIFKYSLGYNDRYMKDLAFVDSVSLEATKQAKIEKAKDTKTRANEIFQDAIKIEPQTPEGAKIREIAVNEALVATYMNNSKLGEYALKARDLINESTGNLRIGDLISPFVKTPANVISLGLEYSLGGVQAVKNIDVIINDFKNGNITDTTRNAIRSTSRNALGLIASMLVMAVFIDDDDYIPDYSLLSPAQRKLIQQKNGVFNSIRIGNKYINLDYFGALASPLVAALEFRRAEGLIEGLFGYGKGTASQLLKLPVIGDLKDIYQELTTKLVQTGDKTFEGLGEWGIDLLSARTIPAFVNDIAKQIDGYERETSGSALNRAISKIPLARESLPKKYNFVTGDPVKVEAYNFLFGARVKTGNFSYEMSQIEEVVESGNNVTLADPTRYGKFKDLPEIEKTQIRIDFANEYSEAISKEMAKGSWNRKDNEKKANTLNKIRSKILDDKKRHIK